MRLAELQVLAASEIRRIHEASLSLLAMTATHTLGRLRSREYYVPKLAGRGSRAAWEAEGSKDAYQRARTRAQELDAKSPATLDAKRREQLNAILAT